MNESLSVRPRMNASGATSIDAALHVRGQLVGVEHVVEGVEERPQVGVDLREHVAGQEAEPLTRFDCGPSEDDPGDLLLRESCDGERHREIGLARTGRADSKGHGALADRVDVALLAHRFGRDLLAAVAPNHILEDLADVLRLVERRDDGADGVRPDLVPALDQLDELVHDRPGGGNPVVRPFDRQLVTAQTERAVQTVAQRVEHAVADSTELGGDFVRD